MVKKLIAQILAISMILSMLCVGAYAEEMLGLSSGSKEYLPSGAVGTTPAEYSFTFGGQKFVFLGGYIGTDGVNHGYRAKDGKNYYLVLADQLYEKVAFDTDNKHIFDVNDSTTVAYWLNNDFISESYAGTKLPAKMIENLDTYEWHTEKSNVVDGYKSEYTTQCKIALMSQYEIKKYNSMYGYNVGANWGTRTPYGSDASYILYVNVGQGRVRETTAESLMSTRPIFWLSEDFFLENKITLAGSYVTTTLQKTLTREKFIDAAGYTEAELDAWFTPPTAVISGVDGNPVEGNDITIDYTYTSAAGFPENGTLIEWYVDDAPDGDFTEKIHTEVVVGEPEGTYTLQDTDGDKYIKVKVTPRSFVAKGATVESEVFGPIYAQAYIDELVGIIDGLGADSVMGELATHNAVFKLDLEMTGLTDSEKEAAVIIFADSDITDFVSLCKNYEDAMAIARLNTATEDTETEEMLRIVLTEEELAEFDLLTDKSEVLAAMRHQGFTSAQALRERFTEVCIFAAVNQAKRTDKYALIIENNSCFETDFTSVEPYILKAAVASVGQYEDFAALEEALLTEIASIEKSLTDEVMLGLTKSGRNPDTSPVPNSVADTPAAYRFEFEGKKFAFLDEKVKDGKYYYLIYADDSYATLPFHDVASNYNNVWSVKDETKLGYWLITEFLSSEYDGTKLPEEILDNIDYKNIWHTEPTAVTDYTTEASMLSVGGISVISAYEFKKYAGRFGTSINGSPTNAWLRTARADNSTTSPLVIGKAVPGETTAPNPNSAYAIRPIFWLSEDFFKENKITNAGSFLAKTLDSRLTYQELLNIGYASSEIAAWFIKPTAVIDKVNGDAIAGETLSVDYTYSSATGFEEAGTVISWYKSFNNITFNKICDSEEYTITEEDAGTYIKASVTPKSNANISSTGSETYSTVLGPVYGSERLSDVLDEIDVADAEDVIDTITPHNGVLKVDMSFEGISDADKAEALQIFADSDINDLENLRKGFVQAKMVAQINSQSSEETIPALLTDVKTGLDLTQYETLEDTSFVVSSMYDKGFTTLETFEEAFCEAVSIQCVNEADRATIATVLGNNLSLFTSDLSEVGEYKLELIGASILGTYEDFETLDAAVTAALSTVNSQTETVQKPTPGSNGGGGGGGGGEGGISAGEAPKDPAPVETVPTAPEENKPAEPAGIYSDMAISHWAYDSVKALSDLNVISGDGNGDFRPEDTIKREEFIKLVVLSLLEATTADAASFDDVESTAWYASYISTAVAQGIINGIDEKTFGVGMEISRQDMAVMIYRAVGEGLKTDKTAAFADMGSVSDYAVEAVNALNAAGLLNGDGTNVNPHQNATRAMAAKMIYSAIEYVKGGTK